MLNHWYQCIYGVVCPLFFRNIFCKTQRIHWSPNGPSMVGPWVARLIHGSHLATGRPCFSSTGDIDTDVMTPWYKGSSHQRSGVLTQYTRKSASIYINFQGVQSWIHEHYRQNITKAILKCKKIHWATIIHCFVNGHAMFLGVTHWRVYLNMRPLFHGLGPVMWLDRQVDFVKLFFKLHIIFFKYANFWNLTVFFWIC